MPAPSIEQKKAERRGLCPNWYIARTNHNQERLAQYSLNEKGFTTYLPFIAKQNKNKEIYGSPLFPSYLFVQLRTGVEGWTGVFSARGVACVLGTGGQPKPVPDLIIKRVREREFDGFVRMGMADDAKGRTFKKGEAIKVRLGDKTDPIDALFVDDVDKHRCLVLINLLGDKRIAQAALAHIE